MYINPVSTKMIRNFYTHQNCEIAFPKTSLRFCSRKKILDHFFRLKCRYAMQCKRTQKFISSTSTNDC